jgi:hypothetical protein
MGSVIKVARMPEPLPGQISIDGALTAARGFLPGRLSDADPQSARE